MRRDLAREPDRTPDLPFNAELHRTPLLLHGGFAASARAIRQSSPYYSNSGSAMSAAASSNASRGII